MKTKDERKSWVVAVDGPAGTGKSSVTKRLADELGLQHIDTGALYRGIAIRCADAGVTLNFGGEDIEKIAEIARSTELSFLRSPKLNPKNRLLVGGVDVTSLIRTPEISLLASKVSAIPEVRAALFDLQQTLGRSEPSILEGRDIGTVIFPDAQVKFFLTADLEERAKRRLSELEAQGADAPSFEELREQIRIRDDGDSSRAIAPLKKAADAIEIDTTHLTLDQVVARMAALIRQKMGTV
jgi:CMP/dCMP kinase